MRYIHCKEQAQMIRKRLKQEFPGTKFSVRIGSDHGRIDIRYINGPGKKAVQEIVNQYQGGGFDGMIDMEYHYTHMILPDGQVCLYKTNGTTGSGGYHEPIRNELPEGAEVVCFMCNYIFVHKECTVGVLKAVLAHIEKKYPQCMGLIGICEYSDGTGCFNTRRWIDDQHINGDPGMGRHVNNELYDIAYNNKESIVKMGVA